MMNWKIRYIREDFFMEAGESPQRCTMGVCGSYKYIALRRFYECLGSNAPKQVEIHEIVQCPDWTNFYNELPGWEEAEIAERERKSGGT